jgi:hypothetical protein
MRVRVSPSSSILYEDIIFDKILDACSTAAKDSSTKNMFLVETDEKMDG